MTNANEPTQAERAAAWENGREERARAREQAIIDRVGPLLAATFERLMKQYSGVAIADPEPCERLPSNWLTPSILAHAVAGAIRVAGIADVSAVRDFILWEPLGRGVGFDLPGFAKRMAERPEWLVSI